MNKEAIKVKKLLNKNKYNQDDCIIGNIYNDNYVQFIPCLKGYHKTFNGDICVFFLTKVDARKRLICPTCKKDLTNELKGKE